MLALAARGVVFLTALCVRFSLAFTMFGWVLLGTTLLLAFVPWRLHRRFANWPVPQATRVIPLFGVGALAGGLVLFGALLLPRAVG